MTFDETLQWLRERLAAPLPPMHRGDRPEQPEGPLTPAAVLAPIVFHDSGPTILLTQRTHHLSKHAGQISFPGGRAEPHDPSPEDTALREAEEEVGLPREHVTLAGRLPEYITITGFRVTPVVGLVRPGFSLQLDVNEVEQAFEVPLAHLLDPLNYQRHPYQIGERSGSYLAVPYGEHFIWGATAAMLMTLSECLCPRPQRPGD